MAIFDGFRAKGPDDLLQEEMKRVGPILFPGGRQQIEAAGRTISGMLDSRVSPEAASRVYASTKYLAYVAKDKSKERVVEYIIRQGMNRIRPDEASAIYDRFIAEQEGAPEVKTSDQLVTRLRKAQEELTRVNDERDAALSEIERLRGAIRNYIDGEITDNEFLEIVGESNPYASDDVPPIAGGEGSSAKMAIVVSARSSFEGVDAEYAWLESQYGKRDVEWSVNSQAQYDLEGKNFDVIEIRLRNGTENTVWFDITSFFGRF